MYVITRVSGTVGKPVNVCIITDMEQADIHKPFMEWVKSEFGQWATAEYLETYNLSTISTTDLAIDRLYHMMK